MPTAVIAVQASVTFAVPKRQMTFAALRLERIVPMAMSTETKLAQPTGTLKSA